MAELPSTPRSRVRRLPDRGSHDLETIHAILDEGLVAHVGFAAEGQPFVIPTSYGRLGDLLYLHGSVASRMAQRLAGGTPLCLTVTLLDGIVLARSAFHHSLNYRSVVLFGTAGAVEGDEEKVAALRVISEHIIPGRWAEVRPPSARELAATTVLRLSIGEASAKVRTGPPREDEDDMSVPAWAGVLPLRLEPGAPVQDRRGAAPEQVPGYVSQYGRGRRR